MTKIFISYRRKESADFVGRLFDRLSGYFGPDSIAMDVDMLISGMDYREEIDKIIANCNVFLPVIGLQWTTITDENGRRRLDNPDDQLRIEVATALQRKATVIPILIHGSQMPRTEDLPADIRDLANAVPIEIQSGLPFNADVRKLLNLLEQRHGLSHPDRRFPLHLVLIPLGILLTIVGAGAILIVPVVHSYASSRIPNYLGVPSRDYSLAAFEGELLSTLFYCTVPLGLGPLLIVMGTRWCCTNKERRRDQLHFSSGIGTRPTPKSGLSVLCLAFGLAALGLGLIAAVPALLFGVWALIDFRTRIGWVRGRSLVVVGLLAALAGGAGTTMLHLSYWRFHGWLSAVERAETALAKGDAAKALSAYQQAVGAYPGDDLYTGICHLASAEIYMNAQNHSKSIDELTTVITSFEPWDPNPVDRASDYVLVNAYNQRAIAFDATGQTDKAEADRRRMQEIRSSMQVPMNDGPPGLFEEAPQPQSEMPPAPVVDPNA